MGEEWKDISKHEIRYKVSNKGFVISKSPIVTNKGFKSIRKEKYLHLNVIKGYHTVRLYDKGKSKIFKVHRLVAEAFIPNPENKPEVNHKNGIKTDNRVENLEWCTSKENINHALANGLRKPLKGEQKINTSKLTDKQVLEIRENKLNLTRHDLSVKYGVKYRTVCQVVNRETWKHI